MKTWCQYLSADTCHMRCNALDSLPGRAFGQYDSDCSAGNSDPFATALLSHKDHVVSEFDKGILCIMVVLGTWRQGKGNMSRANTLLITQFLKIFL